MADQLISIVIPVYNEEDYIKDCVESVLDFGLPSGIVTEILVVDGISNDATVSILGEYINSYSNIRLLINEQRIQSTALNIGIREAKGDYILRIDAHAIYPQNYIELLWREYIEVRADNTGGIIYSVTKDNSFSAKIVQAITTHKFGVGGSDFRTGRILKGYVDTVPYGFFKKSIFYDIGFFDERLKRAQDYEFNKRILNSGGRIWMNSEIAIKYFNQKSFFKFLKKQFKDEGPYNAYMWYFAKYTFSIRHAITSVFSMGVIVGGFLSIVSLYLRIFYTSILSIYLLLSISASVQQARRYKSAKLVAALPISYFLFHFVHGLGVLKGLFRVLFQPRSLETMGPVPNEK